MRVCARESHPGVICGSARSPAHGDAHARSVRRYAVCPPPELFEKDGTLRSNASSPKLAKPFGTIPPSTVRREMTLLKRFVDFAIREHGLLRNALDKAVIDWPTAADERDVRLTPSKLKRLLAHSVHARPCRPRARGAGHVARRPRQRGGSAKLGADLAGLRRCRAGERGQRHRAAPRGACAGRGHSHEAADFAGHRRRPRSPPRSGARPARRHRPLTGNEGGNCRLLRQTRSRCSIGKPFDTRGLASIARTHFFAGAAFQT